VRSELVPVDKELAYKLFGGYAIFFKDDDDRMAYRTWWTNVIGHWHQLPESSELWARESAIADKKHRMETGRIY